MSRQQVSIPFSSRGSIYRPSQSLLSGLRSRGPWGGVLSVFPHPLTRCPCFSSTGGGGEEDEDGDWLEDWVDGLLESMCMQAHVQTSRAADLEAELQQEIQGTPPSYICSILFSLAHASCSIFCFLAHACTSRRTHLLKRL